MEKEKLITAILDAARRPQPAIAESIHYRHKETGKIYGPNGLPFAFKLTDYDEVHVGWHFVDHNGCGYGQREITKEALIARHDLREANARAHFRAELEKMNDKELAEQVAYWIK